jgi:molybdate transport system substrate-binding protein
VYFAGLVQRLGLTEALSPKIRVISGGLVGELVAKGEIELGVQMMSEILAVPGAELVGPFPAEIQSMSLISAGVFAASTQPDAASAFVRFLGTREAASTMAAKGLEPLCTSTA